jgi:hypothetical protein
MAAAVKIVLEDAEAEPIPAAISQLARKLEDTIAQQAADHSQDRGSHGKAGEPPR